MIGRFPLRGEAGFSTFSSRMPPTPQLFLRKNYLRKHVFHNGIEISPPAFFVFFLRCATTPTTKRTIMLSSWALFKVVSQQIFVNCI